MPHRNLHIIVIVLLSFSAVFAETQIAVVDFEALGVSNTEARALTNRLMIELHRTNKYTVLEREMLDKIIEEQKFQLSGCTADQCLVELGQIANVQQIVAGSVSKIGGVFTITSRMICVESGEVVMSAIFDCEGNIGELMKVGMGNIASQLASILPGKDIDYSNSLNETVSDIDGNVYGTVTIGSQEWMAENLRVTRYRDGTPIGKVTDNGTWAALTTGAYCIYNNNASNEVATYGALYNWYAATDSRNIAPVGWHVPTDADWKELEMALGMSQSEADAEEMHRGNYEGSKLAGNAELWNNGASENHSEFGSSGFNALPSGDRHYSKAYYNGMGAFGDFWSANEANSSYAWSRCLFFTNSNISRSKNDKRSGFSVRLVRD